MTMNQLNNVILPYLDFGEKVCPTLIPMARNVIPLSTDVDSRQQEINQKIVNRLLDIEPFFKTHQPDCYYEEMPSNKQKLLAKYSQNPF